MKINSEYAVIIIGAGAAGLMCAIESGKRKRRTLVLDHANKPGKKILMSGGGRCNFTNYFISPDKFISHNPHFCKSALSRFTQWDFIQLVEKHNIPYHEKTLGQLFCDNRSHDIVHMLITESNAADVTVKLQTPILKVEQFAQGFLICTEQQQYLCQSLVIATGGLSIPTMGASPFAYKVAEQFGLHVYPTRAGLVPFTLHVKDKIVSSALSGVSIDAIVSTVKTHFRENILFTHRGLSGPAILQVSSYWLPGTPVTINLLPDINLRHELETYRLAYPNKMLKNWLTLYLPKKFIDLFLPHIFANQTLAGLSQNDLLTLNQLFHHWTLIPNGTEGYRTAEVTLGGIDCNGLSSKTFMTSTTENLYFIGEALDVSGWLGGYNFQWAWSSGWAAGQAV